MKTVSYRHSDLLGQDDHALIHKRLENGIWGALYDRNPDAKAPAAARRKGMAVPRSSPFRKRGWSIR
jgi:hypothetical protein